MPRDSLLFGLIIRGPTSARANELPGPELGTVFNSNLCDRIVDTGLPAKDQQTVPACYDSTGRRNQTQTQPTCYIYIMEKSKN